MIDPLAVSGWALAASGFGTAVALRRELDRRTVAVARACHEIRGPLTAARLGLHLLAGRLADDAEATLAVVEGELRRAGEAVEDAGAAARGLAPVDRQAAVDLAAVARAAVAAARPWAKRHGAAVALARVEGPAWVHGDATRLRQACANLIVNAAEHAGGVVRVAVVRAGDRVRVTVEDDGPGLPAPVAELVRRRRRGRRGHGLTIAADVAVRHGGRLAALPAARGARLALELPSLPAPRAGGRSRVRPARGA